MKLFLRVTCLVTVFLLQRSAGSPPQGEATFANLPGWYAPGNGYQYMLTEQKLTYQQASDECNGWGGTLAQHGIRDRYYFKKIADNFDIPSWIGLDDRVKETSFRWADQRPMAMGWFRAWHFLQPDDKANEDCVIVTKNTCTYLPMRFDDVSCESKHFGMCEISLGNPPQYNTYSYEGRKYAMITAETVYRVARDMCRKWGGKLAETPASNPKLAKMLISALYGDRAMRSLNTWVGVNDVRDEGQMAFDSGDKLIASSINWSTNKYNSDERDCGTLNPRDSGVIQIERCYLTKTILCEKPEIILEQERPTSCLPEVEKCQVGGYPNVDGSCHNLLNEDRGRTKRAFKRMLPADYDDDIDAPRGGFPSRLPSPRAITQGLKDSTEPPSSFASHQMPLWGQFLAHDLTKLGELKDESGALLLECGCGDTHQECFNIQIPRGDPVRTEMQCYSFIRAEKVADVNCDTRIREQENRVTSYVDASNVYGSNAAFFDNLKTEGGLLLVRNLTGNSYYHRQLPLGEQVPANVQSQFECEPLHFDFTNTSCFAGGDIRANEQAALTSGHTAWVRKHNQIAIELRGLNPHWDSDRIFQTTRRIVAAIHQQITYNEFFPVLLGELNMKRFGLSLTKQGYYYGYDSNYDSTIDISFATAAFRLGHTLINGMLSRPNPDYSSGPENSTVDLRSQFFDTTPVLEQNGPGSVLRGMVSDHAMRYDTNFAEALTNHLFARAGHFGRDLPAINIQRGRDHGIPSYMEHRRFCGLSTTTDFADLEDIPPINREKLRRIYSSTEDIDLFPGGISEFPRDNSSGVPGPTFACIIAYQARDLRRGDAFWFENGGPEALFTLDQLKAIKKVVLSRIICDVGEMIQTIQPFAMLQHTQDGNERVNCSSIPRLDLTPFQERENGFGNKRGIAQRTAKDFEWTAWFPYTITNQRKIPLNPAPSLLRHLQVYRTDDVCDTVFGTETRVVNGFYQVRYKCPVGAIKATDFPPVDSQEVYWTSWSNQSSPSAQSNDDYERLSGSNACIYPVAIQAQTADGVPARETGDVFEIFNPFQGLLCKGIHQHFRRCNDYRIRFLCLKDQ